MANKVTFPKGTGYIAINGVEVGHISSSPECYISVVTGTKPWIECPWKERTTIARFKYVQPKKRAKEWCKLVLGALSVAEVVRLITEENLTPVAVQTRVESLARNPE